MNAPALSPALPSFAWFEGERSPRGPIEVHTRTFTGAPGTGPWGGWPGLPRDVCEPVVEDAVTWQRRVAQAEAACREGRFEKVVLARAVRLEAPPGTRFDPLGTLQALRAGHPQSVVFLHGAGERWFLGASPEILVRVEAGRLSTHALAGTRAKPANPLDIPACAAELCGSDKDQREHAAVVADLVERLSPVCSALQVAKAPRVRELPELLHLETPVSGTLRPEVGVLDVVDILHPTAALGGRPRGAALAWLAAHEPFDRGGYGAPFGYTTSRNDGVFCVAIRSVLLTPHLAFAFAGAGVVAGTDPAAEWAETEAKLRTATRALRLVPA